MPRPHRIVEEGGLHHVDNRFSSGEETVAEAGEAGRFVKLVRGVGLERSTLDGATFVALACRVLEVEPSVLGSGRQDLAITRLRELVAAVVDARLGQRAGELGRVLGKHPDVMSHWARKAGQRRAEDPAVGEQHEALDRALAEAASALEAGG